MNKDAELGIAEPGGRGPLVDRLPGGLIALSAYTAEHGQEKKERRFMVSADQTNQSGLSKAYWVEY